MSALADEVRAAVAAEVAPLAEELRRLRSELAARADGDRLVPLAEVLGCSTRAAAARIRRDPELRAIGVAVGRRVLYRRAAVEAYYSARGGGR